MSIHFLALTMTRFTTPISYAFLRDQSIPESQPDMVDWLSPTVLLSVGHRDHILHIFGISLTQRLNCCPERDYSKLLVESSNPTLWVIPGNHDVLDGGHLLDTQIFEKPRWLQYDIPQSRPYFLFNPSPGWIFIGIHNQHSAGNHPDIDNGQFTWFMDRLADLANLQAVLVMHAPIWLTETEWSGSRFDKLLTFSESRNITI